jgi:serine/threonine protein kinase
MEEDFEQGPKRFGYTELAVATRYFSDKEKLGEGGFGSVYHGYLKDMNLDVAIKRVSKTFKQGKKEYASEVKIISRLRHRNLVQLVGWCHGGGELLLVYDLMPNGSLDTHIHNEKSKLPWQLRLGTQISMNVVNLLVCKCVIYSLDLATYIYLSLGMRLCSV